MKIKIENNRKTGRQHGGFGIQILYPGIILPQSEDTGFATIGRIDHAKITAGTLVPMHPHIDDEILTYLRSGVVNHLDSEGTTETISNQKLMLMNAGARFYHEELVVDEGGTLQGLQIFIRPEQRGLKPQVQFHQFDEILSLNNWRKIAGLTNDYPLAIRSSTWIMDMRLETGENTTLPEPPASNVAFLFYLFAGKVKTGDSSFLETGESMLIEDESPLFVALETSDIVLFITQTTAPHFDHGMYSGNQMQRQEMVSSQNKLQIKMDVGNKAYHMK